MNCPFCNDEGFDAIGLKHHLADGYCEEYNKIPTTLQAIRHAVDVLRIQPNPEASCQNCARYDTCPYRDAYCSKWIEKA